MKNNHTEERTYTKQTEQREPGLRTIHITRDLFCDWQEGKLKEPEETDFFTHPDPVPSVRNSLEAGWKKDFWNMRNRADR